MTATDDLSPVRRVLFLCSGNIMRSAFAELFARDRGFPLPVESGATVYRNDVIHPATVRALARRGIGGEAVRRFRPRHLDVIARGLEHPEEVLVLAMTRDHALSASAVCPRVRLLAGVEGGSEEVPDPIDHPDPEPVFARVAELVERWDARLREL